MIYFLFQFYPLQQFMASVQVNLTLLLPMVLSFTAEMIVSLNRIEKFLHMGMFYK